MTATPIASAPGEHVEMTTASDTAADRSADGTKAHRSRPIVENPLQALLTAAVLAVLVIALGLLDSGIRSNGRDIDRLEDKVDARFVAFEAEVDARFDKVDERFAALEADIDARFDKVDARFDAFEAEVDARFAAVDTRLDEMDDKLDDLNLKLTALIAALGVTAEVEAATDLLLSETASDPEASDPP